MHREIPFSLLHLFIFLLSGFTALVRALSVADVDEAAVEALEPGASGTRSTATCN